MIKDGLALDFLIELFVTYKQEVGIAHLLTVLKKGGLESRLMDFLPPNKRTEENLRAQFEEKGLSDVVKLHLAQASQEAKRNLEIQLHDDFNDNKNMKEITSNIKELSSKHDIPEHEIIVLVTIVNLILYIVCPKIVYNRRLPSFHCYLCITFLCDKIMLLTVLNVMCTIHIERCICFTTCLMYNIITRCIHSNTV